MTAYSAIRFIKASSSLAKMSKMEICGTRWMNGYLAGDSVFKDNLSPLLVGNYCE